MKISHNWLKVYIDNIPEPEKTSKILTDIGLEVEGIEKFESVKGGLEGIVIGEVLTCSKHPNADTLSVTTVDVGNGTVLPIVCGAPNVEAGQKVAVATPGTTLYMGDDILKLKKVKIRGEVSEGMICAEDELGLGDDHEGIMVFPGNLMPGTSLKDYLKIESDHVYEIGLTPNRIDAASHYGVARDLAAFMKQEQDVELKKPEVIGFQVDNTDLNISVIVENEEACPRYSGLSITGLQVKESPDWLKNRIKAIGLNPINNIVDITNYVLHETGQPLHAFDIDKITGKKVIVKTLPEGTEFKTLDEEKRKLSASDLMICNEQEGMCIAGVFGGIDSGVTDSTTSIFLESACFNPLYIRKTAKRHLLNTDSSFRFERGSDINNTIYALKRAALLIKDIAGGEISSEITDIYPSPRKNQEILLEYDYLNKLTGKEIEKHRVKNILQNLDFMITTENEDSLTLSVPSYRIDVNRQADVVEEILRIYGYNNIEFDSRVKSALSFLPKPDSEKINNLVSELLSSNGFSEMMANSLTPASNYPEDDKSLVKIFNPLSNDLNAMRKILLFGGLEAIQYNRNRQNPDLKLFEFGNVYTIDQDNRDEDPHKKYNEEFHLALFLSGKLETDNWLASDRTADFFILKGYINLILQKTGIAIEDLKVNELENEYLNPGFSYSSGKNPIFIAGIVNKDLCGKFDITADVVYAEFRWSNYIRLIHHKKTVFKPISKFPEVKRDLSMVLDKKISFNEIRRVAINSEKKLLKNLDIFDVYEGDKIEKGKKSYALSFILQDENQTLKDKQIDKVMKKLASAFEEQLGAQIRS